MFVQSYGSGETNYFSVAAIKRGSLPDVRRLEDLKGRKACFAGVGTLAGWAIPIHTVRTTITFLFSFLCYNFN